MIMKSFFKPVSVALISLAVIGCQKGREAYNLQADDSDVKEVTTQFVLNISAQAPQTKMSASTVQLANNFRGIENAVLMTYNTDGYSPSNGFDSYVNKSTAPEAGKVKQFDLGTLYTTGSINAENNDASDSRRVLQLTIPINTDAVLFYGKAPRSQGAQTTASNQLNGATSSTFSTTPSEIMFSATKILANDEITSAYDATARLMIYVINQCIATSVPATSEVYLSYSDLPALAWSDLGHQFEFNALGTSSRYADQNITLGSLEEVLGNVYYTFTYIKPNEYRAGASDAVKRMIVDMYRVINAAVQEQGTPTDAKAANARRLAQAILQKTALYIDDNNGNYLEISQIKANIDDAVWNNATTGFVGARDLNNYPHGDFGIPHGAAQLAFHAEGQTRPANEGGGTYEKDEFIYLHPNKPLVNPNMTEFEPRKYLHPAELWYYVNSAIRTSTKGDLTVADYPNGVTPWSTDTNWSSSWTARGEVGANTRGVAIKSNVNYGVALMKTAVAFASGVTTLNDNRAALTGDSAGDRVINVADAGFKLHGILIGGVNPRMNWQFTRYYTANATPSAENNLSLFDGVIYDDQIVASTIPTPTGSETYTLVYDNYDSTQEAANLAQNDVYVSLEIENTGDDFWGRDNLIKKGGVFYLVGKLTPAVKDNTSAPNGAQAAITWPTDHQVPPIYGVDGEAVPSGKVAGTSKQIPRVFIQDFMTKVTFRIGQESLKNAYYSVPDLRASQMSMGLSVDLSWENGFEYEIEI